MYKEYEIRVRLKETKPDGKVRSKHSKKTRTILSKEQVENILESHPDRSKQNLFIQVMEVKNGKPDKKSLVEKEIFPTKTVQYKRVLDQFEEQTHWGHMLWVGEYQYPLFKYFLKLKGMSLEGDFIVREDTNAWGTTYNLYPSTGDAKSFKKFLEEWREYTHYNNIRNNIIAALSDPDIENPEAFEVLLADNKIIDRVLATDEEGNWEIRVDKDNYNKIIICDAENSVSFTRNMLRRVLEAIDENV